MKAYLEIPEIERLENAAMYLRDKLLIRLLFHLGCRISEALALEVKDIDFERGTVTIEQLKSRIKLCCPNCNARLGKTHSFCPRCGKEVRQVRFSYDPSKMVCVLGHLSSPMHLR